MQIYIDPDLPHVLKVTFAVTNEIDSGQYKLSKTH